jgi:ADP-heptose:LPS heptosyltransferase
MSKILIFRFSAMGDVAMMVPVLYSFASKYPQHEITVLSRSPFKSLFEQLPSNVKFVSADFNGKHKGLKGLNLLYRELKCQNFDFVADFHAVLRSNYLTFRFKLDGVRTASIDKGRAEKKKLTRKDHKVLVPLQTSFQRYHAVLKQLGFEFDLNFDSIYSSEIPLEELIIQQKVGGNLHKKYLGIAPFAKHLGKIYPMELQEQVVAHFAKDPNIQLYIFGGGAEEKKIIDSWVLKYPTIISMVGKLGLNEELKLINQLDLMFSMDSANMHLAALVNTKVLSLWGATHPHAGFLAWNQLADHIIQQDLPCRPCSVYGNKACHRKDYACLHQTSPSTIIQKIENILF